MRSPLRHLVLCPPRRRPVCSPWGRWAPAWTARRTGRAARWATRWPADRSPTPPTHQAAPAGPTGLQVGGEGGGTGDRHSVSAGKSSGLGVKLQSKWTQTRTSFLKLVLVLRKESHTVFIWGQSTFLKKQNIGKGSD